MLPNRARYRLRSKLGAYIPINIKFIMLVARDITKVNITVLFVPYYYTKKISSCQG